MSRRWIALALAVSVSSLAARAEDAAKPPLLDPRQEAAALSGTWDYATSNHTVSGPCPIGAPMKGQLVIAAEGDRATLSIVSGAVCSPASLCEFSGELTATQMIVSNTDTVDDEGGTATNAVFLSFVALTEGFGKSSSRYVHPEGFECVWGHDLAVSRPPSE
jgi:hypothetical protein